MKLVMRGLFIILFYFSCVGWIWDGPVVKKDRQAQRLYKEGKIDEALSKWRDAQVDSPEKKELHYNIANALHEQKKYENAFNEYEKVLDSEDAELQAKAYYNMGNTHYRMGKLPEAIEDYEKCLDINPDDEDAEYNIEFIRKKMKENMERQESKQQQQQKQEQTQGKQGQEQKEEEEREKQASKEEKKSEEKRQGEERTKEGEMSEEDAVRLLDALKDDEKDLQKELRTQPMEGRYRVDKDW